MFDWATGIIEQTGYLGVFSAMFLENILPPLPSELIMLFAGASASDGELNIILVIIAAIAGSALGLVPWYYAGKWYGQRRLIRFADNHGRFLTLQGRDIEKADKWFDRHGKTAVFFGRFLPAIRTLIAVPAGIMKMPLWLFLTVALLSSGVYDGAFGVLGYYVGGSTGTIEQVLNWSTVIVVGVVIVWYLYRVVTFKHK